QNYTFQEDQTCSNAAPGSGCRPVLFKQTEQLTVRMLRTPGKGWFITDFQGDNGTVQGAPPGPQVTDMAQPDIQVQSLAAAGAASGAKRSVKGGGASVAGLVVGANRFVATIVNTGNAPLSAQPGVHFSLRDANGAELATDDEDLPLPLAANGFSQVSG